MQGPILPPNNSIRIFWGYNPDKNVFGLDPYKEETYEQSSIFEVPALEYHVSSENLSFEWKGMAFVRHRRANEWKLRRVLSLLTKIRYIFRQRKAAVDS